VPDFTPCSRVTSPDYSYDICVNGECVSPGCGDISCNAPGPSFVPPDTDQRACFDASAAVDCTSLGTAGSVGEGTGRRTAPVEPRSHALQGGGASRACKTPFLLY
jgi:hypothetical protein